MSRRDMTGKEKNDRLSVNAINLFVTCLFLFFAVQFSDGGGGFATKINNITAHLNEAVSGLDDTVTYSDYNDTSVYISSTDFHSKGMSGLYNLTNLFIDAIVPEDILMKGLIYFDSNNQIQIKEPDAKEMFSYYRKLVAIVLFLVLCVLLFPLCGLCFCCCRCCGNCGARSQPADKKKDTCKKICHGTLLIVLGTGLLFCVVCAFGSNQQLRDGVDSFPDNIKDSLTDTKTFLDSTNNQVRHLLIQNYREFSDSFLATMKSSSEIMTESLSAYSNATAINALYNFTLSLETINGTLTDLKENSNKLRVYASQLNDALRKVKRDLLNTLTKCEIKECEAVKNNINTLTTNIDFNSLPDLAENIESLNQLNISGIKRAANEGNKQFKSIGEKIEQALNDGLMEAEKQINNTANTITENMNSVTDAVNEVKTGIDDGGSWTVDTARDYIGKYGKYYYYAGLAVSCVLLVVTICIALGLICGICGKRPDGYSDNCCNKGAGSQFLLCAVMFMFLFGFIISVVTIVSLVVGVISEKAICDPIRNPDPNQYEIIRLLDSVNLHLDFDITPSVLLNNCYNNKSAYATFNLNSRFDLDRIISDFDITAQLNQLKINETIIPKDFTILSPDNSRALMGLLEFHPSEDLHRFTSELKDINFTNYSLTELSSKLNDIILKLDGAPYKEITDSLRLSVLHLNTYNDKLLVPMQQLADVVVDNADDLELLLKMNKTSFQVAIEDLISEIQNAETTLRNNGTEQLKKAAERFKEIVLNQIQSYIDRVSIHIKEKVGLCGPLSRVIKASLTSTCEKVLLPWNGFWFSLFWTSILYVIVIIVSVRLANLYQKYKPYGQYVETRGVKRGKKKGKKTKRYEERPIASEVAREYAAGSRPPDGRYADMAPNNFRLGSQNPYNQDNTNLYPGGPQNPYGRSDKNKNYVKSTRF